MTDFTVWSVSLKFHPGRLRVLGDSNIVLKKRRGLFGAQPPDVLEIVFGFMGMLQCDLSFPHATVADQGEDLGAVDGLNQ